MKVRKLIEQLGWFGLDANVYMQLDSRSYEALVWISISDTAELFLQESNFQRVISHWGQKATADLKAMNTDPPANVRRASAGNTGDGAARESSSVHEILDCPPKHTFFPVQFVHEIRSFSF
jgi:hypothetical protein